MDIEQDVVKGSVRQKSGGNVLYGISTGGATV